MVSFTVMYCDDCGCKHMAIVTSTTEIRFLIDRYYKVEIISVTAL